MKVKKVNIWHNADSIPNLLYVVGIRQFNFPKKHDCSISVSNTPVVKWPFTKILNKMKRTQGSPTTLPVQYRDYRVNCINNKMIKSDWFLTAHVYLYDLILLL